MLHRNKYCPHCTKLVATNDTFYEGSPVRTCIYCNGIYIDTDYKETAMQDKPPSLPVWKIPFYVFYPWGLLTAIFLFFVLVYYDSVESLILPGISFVLYIFRIVRILLNRKKIVSKMTQLYNASVLRMINPDYVMLLLDNGYKIPKKYLSKHHPALLSYTPKESKLPKCIKYTYNT